MNLPEDAVLVDTRPRPAYEAGHLPGARHLDLSAPKLRLREEAELKALEGGLTELFQTLGLRSPVVLYDEGLTGKLMASHLLTKTSACDISEDGR